MPKRPKDLDQLVPLASAARQMGCRQATLRSAVYRGRLPAEKRLRDWWVKLGDVEEYLNTRWQRKAVPA